MSSHPERLEEENAASGRDERIALVECTEIASASQKQFDIDRMLENKLTGFEIDVALTKREREILEFVLAGHTNREIAKKLYRTERTIEYHRNRMMRKLGTRTTVELVKRAIAMGIA